MEVNQSPFLLLTRKLLVISLITMLFLRFAVNLLNLWLFHTAELLMLMVDSSVVHLHLSHLKLQLLLQLTPPPTPPRPECCKPQPPQPPKPIQPTQLRLFKLSGSLTLLSNLIHLLPRLIMPLPSPLLLVLLLLLPSTLSLKLPMVP
jgi:hypothetical protein